MAVYLHKQSISVIQRAMHVKTDVRFDIKLKVKESDSHKIPKQIKKKFTDIPLCLMAIDCKCQCCRLSLISRYAPKKKIIIIIIIFCFILSRTLPALHQHQQKESDTTKNFKHAIIKKNI